METTLSNGVKWMEDQGVSVAELPIISLAQLHSKNATELTKLRKAASKTGFFYLDLRGDTEGERVLEHLPGVYDVARKYFEQPDETKAKDIRLDIKASQDLGWKKGRGGESFEISRDEVASMGVFIPQLPQLFRNEWGQICEFSAGCDKACLTLLNSLSTEFAIHHRANQPSNTGLKAVLHPSLASMSDAGDTLHTDSGTLTLLFYKEWGIRAFSPDAKLGAFTPPLEGCALINVGDSLQTLSGGRYHSPKHEVTQPFDGARNRYFLSYFSRPESSLIEDWTMPK